MAIGQVTLNLQEDFLTSNLPFKDTSKRSSEVVAVNQLRLTSFYHYFTAADVKEYFDYLLEK